VEHSPWQVRQRYMTLTINLGTSCIHLESTAIVKQIH
jgi:hypothetical protein